MQAAGVCACVRACVRASVGDAWQWVGLTVSVRVSVSDALTHQCITVRVSVPSQCVCVCVCVCVSACVCLSHCVSRSVKLPHHPPPHYCSSLPCTALSAPRARTQSRPFCRRCCGAASTRLPPTWCPAGKQPWAWTCFSRRCPRTRWPGSWLAALSKTRLLLLLLPVLEEVEVARRPTAHCAFLRCYWRVSAGHAVGAVVGCDEVLRSRCVGLEVVWHLPLMLCFSSLRVCHATLFGTLHSHSLS